MADLLFYLNPIKSIPQVILRGQIMIIKSDMTKSPQKYLKSKW